MFLAFSIFSESPYQAETQNSEFIECFEKIKSEHSFWRVLDALGCAAGEFSILLCAAVRF